MRTLRHTVVFLLVGLTLGVSAASASGARVPAPRDEAKQITRSAMVLLAHLGSLLTSIWSKTGCGIDPFGRCLNGADGNGAPAPGDSNTANGDTGCAIDPAGGCTSSTLKSDEGCAIDPWGVCAGGR